MSRAMRPTGYRSNRLFRQIRQDSHAARTGFVHREQGPPVSFRPPAGPMSPHIKTHDPATAALIEEALRARGLA